MDKRHLVIPQYGCSVADLYHSWRTHLALGKDSPQSRRIQGRAEGNIVEIREVGGLHHHYERRAA
jgi:putative transposase